MGKNTIYVTGHKNPDSDSIISAMAYAYLKQQLGYDAIAVRIGQLNPETEFILNLFNEFPPPFVRDIKTCVRDIEFDDVVTCKKDDNLHTALMLMRQSHKKVIAIVDDRRHLLGMSTISDIVSPLMPHQDTNNRLIRETSIERICDYLNAKLIYKADLQHTDGHIYIAASALDHVKEHRIVITSHDEAVMKNAIERGAATLIASYCKKFSDEILDLAKEKNCNLVLCERDIYDITKNIYFAAPISMIMSTKLTSFQHDDYIEDVKSAINKSRYRSYPILDQRHHIIGTLSRYHVFKHANRNLILVDHNELSQSIEGAEQANILEVIDHHRIGGIKTASPVFFRNEQLGCCATIVTKMFRENDVYIPEDLAGLLCCAIISDTVNFKSVTCTETDIKTAKELADIASLDIKELGPQILAAGASFAGKSPNDIFNADLKKFEINKIKVTIGQCNVVDIDSVLPIKDKMEKIITDYAKASECGIVIMSFTLIDGSGSYLLIKGKEAFRLEEQLAKYGTIEKELYFLPGFISRKLQIVPMVSEALD